jgi:hypothetical protein
MSEKIFKAAAKQQALHRICIGFQAVNRFALLVRPRKAIVHYSGNYFAPI